MHSQRLIDRIGSKAAFVDTPLIIGNSDLSDPLSIGPSALEAAANKRDRFICRCCGQLSRKGHTTIRLGGSPRDIHSLITVCALCCLCFNLSLAGKYFSGRMIWLPEFSQAELNNLVRELYIARYGLFVEALTATSILAALEERSKEVVRRFGSNCPLELTQRLPTPDLSGHTSSIRFLPGSQILSREGGKMINIFVRLLFGWVSIARKNNKNKFEWIEDACKVLGIENLKQSSESQISVPQDRPKDMYYIAERRIGENFIWDILQFDESGTYNIVGEYNHINLMEDYDIIQKKVNNMVLLLCGRQNEVEDLGGKTKTRMLFEVRRSKNDSTEIHFTLWDGINIYTDSAILTLAKGILS